MKHTQKMDKTSFFEDHENTCKKDISLGVSVRSSFGNVSRLIGEFGNWK